MEDLEKILFNTENQINIQSIYKIYKDLVSYFMN